MAATLKKITFQLRKQYVNLPSITLYVSIQYWWSGNKIISEARKLNIRGRVVRVFEERGGWAGLGWWWVSGSGVWISLLGLHISRESPREEQDQQPWWRRESIEGFGKYLPTWWENYWKQRTHAPGLVISVWLPSLPPGHNCTWDSRNFASSKKSSIWNNIRIPFSTLAIFVSHLTSLLESYTATFLALECDNMHWVSPTKEAYPFLGVQSFTGASSRRSSQVPALRRSTDTM